MSDEINTTRLRARAKEIRKLLSTNPSPAMLALYGVTVSVGDLEVLLDAYDVQLSKDQIDLIIEIIGVVSGNEISSDTCDDLIAVLKKARPPSWESLTDEQRLAFLERHPCCRHCGSLDTSCQCWNDD